MRIGIDLHGVADSFPEVLMPLMEAMMDCGMDIIVISGPPADEVKNALTELGYIQAMHYDNIASVVDFLKESGAKMWQDHKGEWWTDDETWWASKAKMCKELGVDMMVDDSHRYMPYFEGGHTRFVLVKRRNNS